MTTAKITTTQIETLRTEAGSAGDQEQVALCSLALGEIELRESQAGEVWAVAPNGLGLLLRTPDAGASATEVVAPSADAAEVEGLHPGLLDEAEASARRLCAAARLEALDLRAEEVWPHGWIVTAASGGRWHPHDGGYSRVGGSCGRGRADLRRGSHERGMAAVDRLVLRELGQVYVTLAAARAYAEAQGLQEEAARQELTRLLLGARLTGEAEPAVGRPAAFRYRSRRTGVDVTARVVLEDELIVVVAVSVRGVAPRR